MMTSSSFMGGLAVDIICFEAIGSSPLDSNCLSLALRAQPLRLGHGQASLPRLSPCEVVTSNEIISPLRRRPFPHPHQIPANLPQNLSTR